MSRHQQLTTTSYAVLGLLCLRPWSAYELTQQMSRSLRYFWPRAESGIYREPQKLIDAGYAESANVAAGPRRTKLVYSATPAGRRALRRWLKTPSAPPQFESEAMVKFFFCDQGTLDDARQALDGLIAHAAALREVFRQINISYTVSPPFPERIHIGATRSRFTYDYAELLQRWASFARGQVESWPDTGPAAAPFGRIVHLENARLAGLEVIDTGQSEQQRSSR